MDEERIEFVVWNPDKPLPVASPYEDTEQVRDFLARISAKEDGELIRCAMPQTGIDINVCCASNPETADWHGIAPRKTIHFANLKVKQLGKVREYESELANYPNHVIVLRLTRDIEFSCVLLNGDKSTIVGERATGTLSDMLQQLYAMVDGESTIMRTAPLQHRGTIHNSQKTGPNDSCPCKSGRKFKKCCMNKPKEKPKPPPKKPLTDVDKMLNELKVLKERERLKEIARKVNESRKATPKPKEEPMIAEPTPPKLEPVKESITVSELLQQDGPPRPYVSWSKTERESLRSAARDKMNGGRLTQKIVDEVVGTLPENRRRKVSPGTFKKSVGMDQYSGAIQWLTEGAPPPPFIPIKPHPRLKEAIAEMKREDAEMECAEPATASEPDVVDLREYEELDALRKEEAEEKAAHDEAERQIMAEEHEATVRIDIRPIFGLLRNMENNVVKRVHNDVLDIVAQKDNSKRIETDLEEMKRLLLGIANGHLAISAMLGKIVAGLEAARIPLVDVDPDLIELPLPTQYSEVANWVEMDVRFQNKLVLHSRALESLANAQYKGIDLMCDALLLLAEKWRAVKMGEMDPVELTQALSNRHLHNIKISRTITKTSAGTHGQSYYVVHDGKRRLLERHVTKGNSRWPEHCLRIYFFWDEVKNLVVVGWLPSHLPLGN